MIFRTVKNANYVCIHKGFLEDENLSFRAKGLLAYCLGRPDNWEFHISHLATVSSEGRDAVYATVKELIKAGYIVRQPSRNKGRFDKASYEIYETPVKVEELKKDVPHPENPDAVAPHTGNPDTVQPDTANPELISNDNILSNENNNKTPNPLKGEAAIAAPPVSSSFSKKSKRAKEPPVEKISVNENVFLTQEQIDSLKNEFGAMEALAMIKTLSNYKHASGRKYKSDYHALVGWVKERHLESKSKKVIPLKGKMSLPTDGQIDGPDASWRKNRL